jgi:transcriptional regulator NrdR family protein
MKHIVKRKGKEENFDPEKIYNTCKYACITAKCTSKETEEICRKIAKNISEWIKKRKEVTSDEIFKKVAKDLESLHKKAGYMYRTHRIID